jgi:arylsulfatase A-like enzyme
LLRSSVELKISFDGHQDKFKPPGNFLLIAERGLLYLPQILIRLIMDNSNQKFNKAYSRREFIKTTGSLLSLTVAAPWLANCEGSKQKNRPNIVCIFSDELSPEFLGSYGGKYPTPNLDALAKRGIRFTRAYTPASASTPSRFALLTGKYPGRCEHPSYLEEHPKNEPYSVAWNTYLQEGQSTIARMLSENGYYTGMAGKWHVSEMPDDVDLPDVRPNQVSGQQELNRRLQQHQEILKERVKADAGFDEANSVLWGNFDSFPNPEYHYHNFPWITRGAVDFIQKNGQRDKPFFLYVASTAVHGPHHAESLKKDLRYTTAGKIDDVVNYQLDKERLLQTIGDMPSHEQHRYTGIAELDHHVGMITEALEEQGILDNTLIIFMADHNLEPGKATCYERGCHVPMIISWPGKIATGKTEDALTENVDILPTLMEWTNISTAESQTDGKSLVPLLTGKKEKTRDYNYYEMGYTRAISDGTWKYIAFRYPGDIVQQMKKGELTYAPNYVNTKGQSHSRIAMKHYPAYFAPDQLYYLPDDPYEQNNLAGKKEYSDELNRLKKALAEILNTFDHPYDLEPIPFMKTDTYQKLTRVTRSKGTDDIPWLERDHGTIVWPPESPD